ncbi:uroporphyrinogen-III C-methyltransferase /precorrin-2 dehydrogenase [Nitrosospira sp. Nsp5]|uniref:Siroheme synthase n=1 Tax=Nitrosospira multiformis TaxID=1231 RepID=A0ABY0TR63_9PROT|nr:MULTISPECIES: siroheme synthase CysG [Nitrosospira]PTR09931.1 uroporphyrinogen-III C-methyltransferase /precorrin-2 dehydrogenase [Nitrosospira sp. Nsp5]SDR01097.1 uroporphyrinogen-III C-methyltransferase /precorrin-2 dehydrogenase [Nitrosospira multiformis]
MDFLPIFVDIKHRNCLVVGGGEVAARKIALLLRAGAHITIIAPELCTELSEQLHEQLPRGAITHRAEAFRPDHMGNAVLVIAATGDTAVNREVSAAAGQLHIPVNVVDNPALCSFIMPSIVDRSPVLVAVSSGGTSPVLARLLRARLETMIPAAYGRLAAYAAGFRERVKSHFSHPGKRRIFWEKALQGPFAEMVFAGRDRAAQDYLERSLESEADEAVQGEVYLVGAGPGDPELLTFRAMRLMQQADVVVYDRLVSPEILDMVRRDASRIYAGKERSKHVMPQESINELLVRLAKEGKRVLRLKGGDPFIFGRGGEEIETLSGQGIPFQVVPGITAASGAASYAGIPLTHRDYAQSCIFVTGHLKDGSVNLDWLMLARPNQTIVIYMGLLGLPVLCRQLIAHGLSTTTPAAIVQQASTRNQKVLTGTLETLPDLTATAHLTPPTLIIVGEVVKLHQRLAWFEPEGDLRAGEPAASKKV